MKVISDIRIYKSSENENHIGFASKPLNLAVRRVTMKLREQGFSLGEFDHLYLNFTTCRPEGTIELIDKVDRYHPWYRYCDIGVSQYGIYRVMGENKPILTPVGEVSDWKKLVRYDFDEPTNGLWCHFLTDEEMKELFSE